MKLLSIFSSLIFALVVSFSSVAQEMPSGALVMTMDCTLKEGRTMNEAVQWGRNEPRTGNEPMLRFYRESVFGNQNYKANYDFQIANYFPSYTEMVSRQMANIGLPANRPRPAVSQEEIFTCNDATMAVSTTRNVPEKDAFDGQATLMTTRFCRLNDGATIADAWEFINGIAAAFEDAGDNSIMQMTTRSLGPVSGRIGNNNAVIISTVPATAMEWAERMDMPRNGLRPGAGLDQVMSCNFPAMWITHSIFRANP